MTRSRDGQPSLEMHVRSAARLDFVGAGLFAGAAVWMLWASAASGGSAAPGVELLLACGLVLVATRAIGPHARIIVPAAALVAAVIIAAQSETGVLSTGPLDGPLKYGNANAALYVQAAIAGLMLASGSGPSLVRILGGVGAGVFATLPFIVHALAGAWLVVLLPGIALLSAAVAGARAARAAVAVCGLLFVGSLTATIALGASYSPTEPSVVQRVAAKAVDEVRLVLWHDAFVIMRDHPGAGVGPRRYQVVSPIARTNRDNRWAHNEFLQQGAEGGAIGLVLCAAIFVWGFARLWTGRVPDAITALSAASLAALGIHACVDYVMHFPAIPIFTASLVATGMTSRQEPAVVVRKEGMETHPDQTFSGAR